MQLGTLLPLGDIGGDPAVLRDYAEAAAEIGYDFIEAPDHVLGVNPASRPGWDRNTSADLFHDPFVLFGYLAGCVPRLGFSTGVLILPQGQVMQALWAEDHVTFKGRWHTIDDAGINPRPKSGKVPLWFGGHHERTLERIAKYGDGWMPNAYPPDQSALEVFARLRRLTEAAGRDPAAVGIEVW